VARLPRRAGLAELARNEYTRHRYSLRRQNMRIPLVKLIIDSG
jgi:hypothetical protein